MRTHVVMVPGFGGFDALGQLRYYVRVTEQFQKSAKGTDAGLHSCLAIMQTSSAT